MTTGAGVSVQRIVIAEDEPGVASFLEKGLRTAGYATHTVESGVDAVREAGRPDTDLLLLDLGLPDLDGLDVLRALRAGGCPVPVIVITHRDAVEDRVAGLDLGAADYVTKPFSVEELLARVRARLRDARATTTTRLLRGGVTVDLLTRAAEVDGRLVELTPREFQLLVVLMQEPERTLSREQLLERVWGYAHDPGSNVVDVAVRCLRRKLGTGVIRTVRGTGYRFVDHEPLPARAPAAGAR